MSEKQQTVCDPFDYLADAFWASLLEESANELADFKKRFSRDQERGRFDG